MKTMNFHLTFEEISNIIGLAMYAARKLDEMKNYQCMKELQEAIFESPEEFFTITDENPF